MKEELQKVLDEILESCIDLKLDAELLHPHLQSRNYLSNDEVDLILTSRTSTGKLMKLFTILKSKQDDLFLFLQKHFSQNGQGGLLLLIQTKLEQCGNHHLIWHGSMEINASQAENTLKTAWDNLKIHYKERLEFVESYWRQFGVRGILNLDTFYNHNIVISNEKYKQIQKKIKNFDDVFSTGYKRIIVMAEAGYGKSTFVHEMARQWVKGDKDWTRKFEFSFLFRLTEVNENESKSFENLLTTCLCHYDASIVYKWLKCGKMSKALFIFDGLDELRQNFCQEVNDIIFGGKVNLETVVITSRQCDKLEGIKKDTHRKLYIELKGYSDGGVFQQLKKFSIPVDGMKKDLRDHLKIPLFNTIFCITHSESSLGCTSICSSIHSFVNFAINRYRNSNQCFTEPCGEELLLALGQAAQNKFSFIHGIHVPYPNVSSDHLLWAVNSGLLHKSSLKEDLVFAHQTIAEYCTAYFWWKTSRLAIKECRWGTALLNEPPNATMKYLEPFSQFVCYLCPEFKEILWRKFVKNVPIFDAYENLPVREYTKELKKKEHTHAVSFLDSSSLYYRKVSLLFSSHSVDDQITIMNKLHFQETCILTLRNGQFEPEKLFKTIRKLKALNLYHCTFYIGAEEFFLHFTDVQYLTFDKCNFYNLNVVDDGSDPDEFNPSCPLHLSLQKLKITECSEIETFLSFIMKHAVFMKSFELKTHSYYTSVEEEQEAYPRENSRNVIIENDVDDCGIGWISELQSNKCLCVSIESCTLEFAYPSTLIPFIETIKIMQNIKQLNLTVRHKLTKLQANALADLLQVRLFGLNDINLDIKMENKEDYEPILKNLSKLSVITSLCLLNRPFTTNTLKYLIDIFNTLKLEQCTLKYQEIFFEERIINTINSCISLKKITFYRMEEDDSNYEFFKKGIENKDRRLIIQNEPDYSFDSDD